MLGYANDNLIPVEYIKALSEEDCIAWKQREACILSYPRSGCHWMRRMLGEIQGLRSGTPVTMSNINRTIGFTVPPVNRPEWRTHDLPLFYSTHAVPCTPKIFLRRNFLDVLRSCWKAEEEIENCWFSGGEEQVFTKWKRTTTYGTINAELVLDYDLTIVDPKASLRAIYNLMETEVTNEELDRAVRAGSRENMLLEQNENKRINWEVINEKDY